MPRWDHFRGDEFARGSGSNKSIWGGGGEVDATSTNVCTKAQGGRKDAEPGNIENSSKKLRVRPTDKRKRENF